MLGALGDAWRSGDWGGFVDRSLLVFNENYNPLYAIGKQGYLAYVAGKTNDFRAAFKHGTIGTILAVLAVVTTGKTVKAIVSGKAKIHANNLNTTRPTRRYSLRDRVTGEVMKYGETTLGTKRYSQSRLKQEGLTMEFEAGGTKRQMHDWQHEKILEYKETHDGQRPPLNKSDW